MVRLGKVRRGFLWTGKNRVVSTTNKRKHYKNSHDNSSRLKRLQGNVRDCELEMSSDRRRKKRRISVCRKYALSILTFLMIRLLSRLFTSDGVNSILTLNSSHSFVSVRFALISAMSKQR